ncbi:MULTISPECIES: deoxyribonuclease V [Aminobacterium]|uniref:deoxyribonuclease V n=1 Tax=Aminobacterium TaxID=81466 RepID=UPI0004661391|nr:MULTISPECIES: deoxyribonuclease V [Aminobacterium]
MKFIVPDSFQHAIAEQRLLAEKVSIRDEPFRLTTVAGVDVAYSRRGKKALAIAGIVCMEWGTFSPISYTWAIYPVSFPYLTGLLSYREVPALFAALERLELSPDLWMIDGAGIAHPRRIGLASHFGVLTNFVTIGVAKSHLVGVYDDPGNEKGSRSPLFYQEEHVGYVLRSRNGVKPLFISPGHRISLEKSVELVLKACIKYRLPEPTRAAHQFVTQIRRKIAEEGWKNDDY